ncbi:hypothetical protein F0A17_19515 [Billgrantia pellis]|uniref:DnaT DNA-binding domain-containing protein n=1 Tax=Billgrantia pellis TaxID=2606936 RepID=A0A7V7KF72_9GAMM|nr:helix-turn-helix domain-containing protein [Halomonas pellis]KAA0010071.1 hypothetical protein F0A17_19515 [Halomonas pellis]
MSVQAIAWALHQQVVTDPGARHVLIGLANHADEEGRYAFPSVELLSRYTGLKRRTVQEKLKLLREVGAIQRGNQRVAEAIIERADRRPVVYDLRMELGRDGSGVGDEDEVSSYDQRDAISAPRNIARGADTAPRHNNGVRITAARGAESAPEPSLTNSNSHTRVDELSERRCKQFLMTYGWQPDLNVFGLACQRRDMPDGARPSQAELADFVGYYSETNRAFTEQGWHDRLARWVYENRMSQKGTENNLMNSREGYDNESCYGHSPSRRISAAEARDRARRVR